MQFPVTFRSIMPHIGVGGTLLGILTSLKIDPCISYGLSAFCALCSIILDVGNSLSESRIIIGADSDGSRSYDLIRRANDSIIVTHFADDIPTDAYISLLIEKCNNGIPLTRFVNKNLSIDDERHSWMKRFNGVPNYHLIKVTYNMPLDVMIFDRKIVKMSFPESVSVSSRVSQRCIIRNKIVASMFQQSLDSGVE